MRTIGITGGIGAGKSYVLEYIRSHFPCVIYLADDIAKALEKKGCVCFDPIVACLGEEILGDDGEIVPAKMAQKIFSDDKLRTRVNEIIHPAVRSFVISEIERLQAEGEIAFFFLEAALLIEERYDLILDELWYVYADPEVRASRLSSSRGYSDEKIRSIMSKQQTDKTFREYCKVIIDNSGDFETTCHQIDSILEEYL